MTRNDFPRAPDGKCWGWETWARKTWAPALWSLAISMSRSAPTALLRKV